MLTAGGIVLAIGALYLGREIFVPFALAILLSFVLTPLVNWLRRWKVPRIAAVLIAVSIAFIVVAGIALVVGRQLVQLASNLPNYQTTITEKIRSLQSSAPGGGVVDAVTTTMQDLGREISGDEKKSAAASSRLATGSESREPVTVRVEPPQPRPLELIRSVIGPLLAPLATSGLVVIFVIFVLLEREDLRDRFIKLAGAGDLQKSTQAINDAASRVSRYLLMQLVVNLTYGVPIGVALYFVGVPNAILWGLLAAVLRFIPYLGPFLAAIFPVALAIAVDPGWTMLFWVVGLFVTAELVSNNVVEPWLYGSSTGLSSLAIIIAAIFWTMLWGPVGLFLATPLTVCLVVMGRYVPQLEFLGVLLGSDPVLAPEEQLYQRLLAGNLEEAVEFAENYVDECSSRELYDNVGIPALRLRRRMIVSAAASTPITGVSLRIRLFRLCGRLMTISAKKRMQWTREITPRSDHASSVSLDARSSIMQRRRCSRRCSRSAPSAPRSCRRLRSVGEHWSNSISRGSTWCACPTFTRSRRSTPAMSFVACAVGLHR
ncbi:putative PurR-regulated permease PerM [Bradyrhizobium yuanmingense]|uniref:PurR-regulated permease PerM n=1 Tax=Bradyrhizobium yuanmingense TaxID=108015 RepID=A0ABV4GD50_9BRAD